MKNNKSQKNILNGWQKVRLGDYLVQKPDYGINAASTEFSESLPAYLRITDISEDGKFLPEKKTSVDNLRSKDYILDIGDIVFARTGASVGKTYLYNKDDGQLVFAGFLIRIKPNENKLEPKFLNAYTHTKKYFKWVGETSTRSGQPGINSVEYTRLSLLIPPLHEQKRIVSVLEVWDEMIEELVKKIKIKKNIKKGLMQELLSGKKRLSGFNEKWQWINLGDICKQEKSKISANSLDENNGKYKIYGASGFLKKINFYQHKESYISIVKDGAGVGRLLFCEPKTSTLGTLDNLKAKGDNNLSFLYSLLQQVKFKKYIVGSTIPHIYFKDYKIEKINIPTDIKEQKAIADILVTAGHEIEKLEEKLRIIKEQKKFLLNNLITGKIRT